MSSIHAVIMAGGVGSRFWPMSRSHKPKQFLDFMGSGKTLIQMTFDRLTHVCAYENIWVVCHSDYIDLVKSQLPKIKNKFNNQYANAIYYSQNETYKFIKIKS